MNKEELQEKIIDILNESRHWKKGWFGKSWYHRVGESFNIEFKSTYDFPITYPESISAYGLICIEKLLRNNDINVKCSIRLC